MKSTIQLLGYPIYGTPRSLQRCLNPLQHPGVTGPDQGRGTWVIYSWFFGGISWIFNGIFMDLGGCSRDCGGYFMDFSGFSMDVDGHFW